MRHAAAISSLCKQKLCNQETVTLVRVTHDRHTTNRADVGTEPKTSDKRKHLTELNDSMTADTETVWFTGKGHHTPLSSIWRLSMC